MLTKRGGTAPEGAASYHFDGPADCYIHYCTAMDPEMSAWATDDGKELPLRKTFLNPSFNSESRVFTGRSLNASPHHTTSPRLPIARPSGRERAEDLHRCDRPSDLLCHPEPTANRLLITGGTWHGRGRSTGASGVQPVLHQRQHRSVGVRMVFGEDLSRVVAGQIELIRPPTRLQRSRVSHRAARRGKWFDNRHAHLLGACVPRASKCSIPETCVPTVQTSTTTATTAYDHDDCDDVGYVNNDRNDVGHDHDNPSTTAATPIPTTATTTPATTATTQQLGPPVMGKCGTHCWIGYWHCFRRHCRCGLFQAAGGSDLLVGRPCRRSQLDIDIDVPRTAPSPLAPLRRLHGSRAVAPRPSREKPSEQKRRRGRPRQQRPGPGGRGRGRSRAERIAAEQAARALAAKEEEERLAAPGT